MNKVMSNKGCFVMTSQRKKRNVLENIKTDNLSNN